MNGKSPSDGLGERKNEEEEGAGEATGREENSVKYPPDPEMNGCQEVCDPAEECLPFASSFGDKGGFTKKDVEPVVLSLSREMVPVYGEKNNKLRDWAGGRRSAAQSASPVFHAHLSHVVSPVQFYVQPKCLDPARHRVHELLNDFYTEDMPHLTDEQLFTGSPCVVQWAGHERWTRARVLTKPETGNSLLVMDVDGGKEMFLDDRRLVKPLFKRFAKVPPLALRCRIKGVSINDLETARLEAFDELMEEIGYRARIRLWTKTEPYLVKLLHPTVDHWDIGAPWLPRIINRPPQPLEEDGLTELMESEGEEERPPAFVETLPRMIRPPNVGLIPVRVMGVEGVRSIYLLETSMESGVESLAQKLHSYYEENWKSLPGIPEEYLRPETACAVKDSGGRERWIRGIVRRREEEGVRIQAYDHGGILPLIPLQDIHKLVKPLAAEFGSPTCLWEGRLMEACAETPIPTETEILRGLLPPGTKCEAELERKRGPPWKVDLFLAEGYEKSVLEAFMAEKERLFVTRSTALVIHKG